MCNILVTCVGSGVGQSVVDGLLDDESFNVIGCDANSAVYGRVYCHKFIKVGGIYNDGYIDELITICIENEVSLVVPGHDYELELFSRNIDRFLNKNIKVVVSQYDIIKVSRDKKLWHDYFKRLNCSVVDTYTPSEIKKKNDSVDFPLIVKPSAGSASQGLSLIHNREQLESFEFNERDIVQPYLLPKKDHSSYSIICGAVEKGRIIQVSEISVQIIFSRDSVVEGVFISENSLKNGIPTEVKTIKFEDFEFNEQVVSFGEALSKLNVIGPVNLQGRVTEAGLIFFEMNMRFTGITGTRSLLGFNEVSFVVRDILSLSNDIQLSPVYTKVGVRQVARATIQQVKDLSKQAITILGAGSFVGQQFLKKLSEEGFVGVVNLIYREKSNEKYKRLVEENNNLKIRTFSNSSDLLSVYCNSDIVVNFASALATQEQSEIYDSIFYQSRNLDLIERALVPKVINISSQSVYSSNKNELLNESSETASESLYSFQKLFIEQRVENLTRQHPSCSVVNVRLSRVLSSDEPKRNGFYGQIVRNVYLGEKFELDSVMSVSNLIHVSDVAAGLYALVHSRTRKAATNLNLGGENISMFDFIERVERQVNRKALYVDRGKTPTVRPIDSSTFLSLTGFAPEYSIDKIIESNLSIYRR